MSTINRIPGYPRHMFAIVATAALIPVLIFGGSAAVTAGVNYVQSTQEQPYEGPEIAPGAGALQDYIVGMSLDEAQQVIAEAGFRSRIVSVNGVPSIITADWVNNRINLDVMDGKITGSKIG